MATFSREHWNSARDGALEHPPMVPVNERVKYNPAASVSDLIAVCRMDYDAAMAQVAENRDKSKRRRAA